MSQRKDVVQYLSAMGFKSKDVDKAFKIYANSSDNYHNIDIIAALVHILTSQNNINDDNNSPSVSSQQNMALSMSTTDETNTNLPQILGWTQSNDIAIATNMKRRGKTCNHSSTNHRTHSRNNSCPPQIQNKALKTRVYRQSQYKPSFPQKQSNLQDDQHIFCDAFVSKVSIKLNYIEEITSKFEYQKYNFVGTELALQKEAKNIINFKNLFAHFVPMKFTREMSVKIVTSARIATEIKKCKHGKHQIEQLATEYTQYLISFLASGQAEVIFRELGGKSDENKLLEALAAAIVMQAKFNESYQVQHPIPQHKSSSRRNSTPIPKRQKSIKIRVTNTNVKCICGKGMIRMRGKDCYTQRKQVKCHKCGDSKPIKKLIYHCPMKSITKHPNGYNLCVLCGSKSRDSQISHNNYKPKQQQQTHHHKSLSVHTFIRNVSVPDTLAWKEGDECEIYSESQHQWIRGRIDKIIYDEKGPCCKVAYDKNGQRFSKMLSPDEPYMRPVTKSSTDYESDDGVVEYEHKFVQIQEQIDNIKQDNYDIQQDIHEIKQDVDQIRQTLSGLESKIQNYIQKKRPKQKNNLEQQIRRIKVDEYKWIFYQKFSTKVPMAFFDARLIKSEFVDHNIVFNNKTGKLAVGVVDAASKLCEGIPLASIAINLVKKATVKVYDILVIQEAAKNTIEFSNSIAKFNATEFAQNICFRLLESSYIAKEINGRKQNKIEKIAEKYSEYLISLVATEKANEEYWKSKDQNTFYDTLATAVLLQSIPIPSWTKMNVFKAKTLIGKFMSPEIFAKLKQFWDDAKHPFNLKGLANRFVNKIKTTFCP
eukprot:347537_1